MHKGKKIRELLIQKKITQVKFAEDLGLTKQRVGQLLEEEHIKMDRLIKISRILDVPLIELVEKDEINLIEDKEGNYDKIKSLEDQLAIYKIACEAQQTTIRKQEELIDILRKAFPDHNINIKQTGTSD